MFCGNPSWRKPGIDVTRVHDDVAKSVRKIFQPAPRAMQFRQTLIVTCWSLWLKPKSCSQRVGLKSALHQSRRFDRVPTISALPCKQTLSPGMSQRCQRAT